MVWCYAAGGRHGNPEVDECPDDDPGDRRVGRDPRDQSRDARGVLTPPGVYLSIVVVTIDEHPEVRAGDR